MQKELEELQPKLVTAKDENAKMMVVIERESAEVEARRKVVKKDEEVANAKAAEAKALKDEVPHTQHTHTCIYTSLSLSLPLPPSPLPFPV